MHDTCQMIRVNSTSGFMEFKCYVCVSTKAKVIVHDVKGHVGHGALLGVWVLLWVRFYGNVPSV